MRNTVNMYMNEFRQDRRKQLKLGAVLAALAVIVAGIVFWQLHDTGLAMTNEVFCGLDEHTHDENCYEQILTCDNGEEDHVHDEGCYETVLTCQIPEHTHTIECMTDETANVETADVWEATLPELTGIWTDDVAAVAESQIGYTESTANFTLSDDGETHMGYTRYGAWYGNAYGDWDAMFVSFCLYYAGISEEEVPYNSGARAMSVEMEARGLLSGKDGYTPDAGDLIFFDTDQDGQADHTGIITDADKEILTVVEGDFDDAVAENVYASNDPVILSFGILPEQEDTGISQLAAGDDDTVYTYENFYLWIFDRNGTKLSGYSDYENNGDEPHIEDVLSYTEDGQTYHLIPVSYFEEALGVFGYTFDSDNTAECPFRYVPSAYSTISYEEATGEATYYSVTTVGTGDTSWYVRVQDTTGLDPARSNIFYTEALRTEPEQVDEFYLWIYNSSGVQVFAQPVWDDDSNQFVGEGIKDALQYTVDSETYYLIPVTYFSESLEQYGYVFSSDRTSPLWYAPNAEGASMSSASSRGEYEAVTTIDENGEEVTNWYVRVQDTTGQNPARSNIYYRASSVVLNLGNGNGRYNFADYSGSRQEGTLLRYTTSNLEEYANTDGEVTVNLPSNGDLDQTFTVVDGKADLPDVTVALGNAQAYDYELVGWVNIATGEYYDVSEGPVTAKVNLDDENVFYADWIAASYDHGSAEDTDLRTDTVSTKGFVTMHMFDYNELFNLYSESVEQNVNDEGYPWEAWTDSGSLYYNLQHTGVPATESFIFVNNGTTGYSNQTGSQAASTGGMLSWPNYKTSGNTWTGTGAYPRDAEEIWGITSPYSTPLNMLFDTSERAAGVHYVGDADYLFWIDEDGYYTYNSKKAAATYNQSDSRFYVYKGTQSVSYTSFSCFLPYNTYGSTLSALNGTVDYWFGMDMEVQFYLPSAAGNGGNLVDNKDMVFNFSGDDDILIFIDDELVLDMSGIHDEAFGSINFTDGTVTMGMSTDANGNIIDGKTSDLSLSSGNHTLKVYYMERGGYASNLEIQFNVTPSWVYESGEVQTVTAEKVWQDSSGNTIDPEDLPEVYKTTGVEVGLFDKVGEEKDDEFGYTKDGDIYTVTFTDDSDVTRTYVYNSSVPSLTYTEVADDGTITASGTDDQVDSEGRVVDKDGYVVAWFEDGYLHIRMDKQTLNSNNNWYYAWELLDPEGQYEVLELTGSSSYATTGKSGDLTEFTYWSVVGSVEIEERLEYQEESYRAVILTEAAQEASNAIGDTKEAMGWVIVGTESGIEMKQIKFSQIATLEHVLSEGYDYWLGVYGVTSQSEVGSLGTGAIWYMEDAEHQDDDINGTVEGFYLYCYLGEDQYYLALNEEKDGLMIVDTVSAASEFFYDSLGELMIEISEGETVRVEILPNGTISIGQAELEAALDDIRIYMLSESASTTGFSFTAYNSFQPVFTIEKVDGNTGEPMAGVSFALTNGSGEYYGGLDENNEVVWSETEKAFETDENGKLQFYYLSDDTYTLTEMETLVGYSLLPSAVDLLIENGVVGNVKWTSSGVADDIYDYITISNDGLTITLANRTGAELPNTGGTGTWLIYMVGGVMSASAAVVLIRRRRING